MQTVADHRAEKHIKEIIVETKRKNRLHERKCYLNELIRNDKIKLQEAVDQEYYSMVRSISKRIEANQMKLPTLQP